MDEIETSSAKIPGSDASASEPGLCRCVFRARRELALALARAEQTYALAVRNLERFDEYLSGVRARLQKDGYLASTARRGRSPLP